jgi:hypothetical protein
MAWKLPRYIIDERTHFCENNDTDVRFPFKFLLSPRSHPSPSFPSTSASAYASAPASSPTSTPAPPSARCFLVV